MSNTVQRYYRSLDSMGGSGLVPDEDGDWVRYEDYESLQAKVAAAENSAEALRANLVTALNTSDERERLARSTPDERAVLEVCANCWDEDHIIRTIMKWREDRASNKPNSP